MGIPTSWLSHPLTVCEFSQELVRALVYRHGNRGGIRVLGFSECANPGYRGGEFVSLAESTECLVRVLEEARKKAGTRSGAIAMNLDDPKIESVEVEGESRLEKGEEAFQLRHLRQARERAKASVKPCDKHLVYCQDAAYLIDGKHAVENPVGVYGKTVTVRLHLLFSDSYQVQNLENIAERASVRLKALYPSVLAALKGLGEQADPAQDQILMLRDAGLTHWVHSRYGAIQEYVTSAWAAEDDSLPEKVRSFLENVDPEERVPLRILGRNGNGMSQEKISKRTGRSCEEARVRVTESELQDPAFGVLVGLAYLHHPMLRLPQKFDLIRSLAAKTRRTVRSFTQEYF